MMRNAGTADSAVGMMDGAYFTSRSDLLDFFNTLLDMNLTKIEQTASGAVACQLVDYIFPGSVPMKRVNWEAKSSYEFVQNYKLLQAAFSKNRVQKHVDVDRLIRAKYQDNLEFCQWLKAFYEQAAPPCREDYDPVAVRAKGKGGKNAAMHFQPGKKPRSVGGSSRAAATSRSSSQRTAAPASMTAKKSSSGPSRAAARSQKENTANGSDAKPTGPVSRRSASGSTPCTDASETIVADATLMKKNAELMSRNAELEIAMSTIETERDFYFEKLRGIEVMLQVHQENGPESDPDALIKRIFKVLYATSEDNVEVDDEGKLLGDISDDEELLNDGIGEENPDDEIGRNVVSEPTMEESLLEESLLDD